MKLILLIACVASAALAGPALECKSKRGENLIQFNGRNQDIFFPCKYWAVRDQQCGKYEITLSPGNIWHYPKYQLDTLWLGIRNTENGRYWEGRTTNKLAVKFFNSEGATDLFNKREGNLGTANNFDYDIGRNDKGVYIEDKEQTFRVTFTPWDPSNRNKYGNSDFQFECFDKDAVLNDYPVQLCGGAKKREVLERTKTVFNLPDRFRANVVYFDTFTNPSIVQTNPKCTNATDILVNTCQNDAQRLNAINNCQVILHSQRHTECVTNYVCDPMDIFNACLLWGCTGSGFDKNEKQLCYAVAEGIDFCPDFSSSGNLTARVEDANCYKDFLSIGS